MKTNVKKYTALLLAAMLLLTVAPFAAFAEPAEIAASGKCGDNVTYTLDANGVLTLSGTGETYDGAYTFDYDETNGWEYIYCMDSSTSPLNSFFHKATKVVVKEGVTSIGSALFAGLRKVTEVSLPKSLKRIGDQAFEECISLSEIIVPEGVETIGARAFAGCVGAMNAVLPATLTAIGANAFARESGVQMVEYQIMFKEYVGAPVAIRYTGTAAQWKALTKNVDIDGAQDSVIQTGYVPGEPFTPVVLISGFIGSPKLSDIEWSLDSTGCLRFTGKGAMGSSRENGAFNPYFYNTNDWESDGVTSIDAAPVYRNLITSAVVGPGITSIGNCVFKFCTELTQVSLPEGLESIGIEAFEGCTALPEIALPETLAEIGPNAFHGCKAFTSVTLPKGLKTVGTHAFAYCSALETVTFNEALENLADNVFTISGIRRAVNFENTKIKVINEDLFAGSSLESILLPAGVKKIAKGAFKCCTALEELELPEGVTEIGERAFCGCSPLKRIYIPASVTRIGPYAFADYSKQYRCKLGNVYFGGTREQWEAAKQGPVYGDTTITHAVEPKRVKVYFNASPNKAHVWNEGEITLEPTFTAAGERTYTCAVCGKTRTEELPKLTMKEADGKLYAAPGVRAKDVLAEYAGAQLRDIKGNAPEMKEQIGSGSTLKKADGTLLTVIRKGDNNGDGMVTAEDARFALRTAVELETPTGWRLEACDVDGNEGVTAEDARVILRAAVEIEPLPLFG